MDRKPSPGSGQMPRRLWSPRESHIEANCCVSGIELPFVEKPYAGQISKCPSIHIAFLAAIVLRIASPPSRYQVKQRTCRACVPAHASPNCSPRSKCASLYQHPTIESACSHFRVVYCSKPMLLMGIPSARFPRVPADLDLNSWVCEGM